MCPEKSLQGRLHPDKKASPWKNKQHWRNCIDVKLSSVLKRKRRRSRRERKRWYWLHHPGSWGGAQHEEPVQERGLVRVTELLGLSLKFWSYTTLLFFHFPHIFENLVLLTYDLQDLTYISSQHHSTQTLPLVLRLLKLAGRLRIKPSGRATRQPNKCRGYWVLPKKRHSHLVCFWSKLTLKQIWG